MRITINLLFSIAIIFSSIKISYSDNGKQMSPAIINLLFEGLSPIVANDGKIIVTVKDYLTNKPVRDIRVTISPYEVDSFTGINGSVSYSELMSGDYIIFTVISTHIMKAR
jgi:hypothetical protein